jgi:hypothetical protein
MKNDNRLIIYRLFDGHLKSIGVVSFAYKSKGLKRYYLSAFVLIFTFLVFAQGFPYWMLVIPFIPLIIFWILYIVDLNIMVQCLVKIQKILIEENGLVYDLNQLLDFLQDYAKENDFFNRR